MGSAPALLSKQTFPKSRDISVVLQISITKVLKVLKSGNYQIHPKNPHYDCLEIDEFWTYVGKKKNNGNILLFAVYPLRAADCSLY
jgi:hypothetical protein